MTITAAGTLDTTSRGASIGVMPNKPKTPVSTFRLPLDLKAQAQVAAEANGTTLTAVVVAALEQYVKKNRKR